MYFEFIIKYFFTTLALTLLRLRAASCGVKEKIKIENYHFLLPSQKAHKNECGREIFHVRAAEIDEALSLKYCRNLWSIELSWRGHRRTINKMPFEDKLFISLFSLHSCSKSWKKERVCYCEYVSHPQQSEPILCKFSSLSGLNRRHRWVRCDSTNQPEKKNSISSRRQLSGSNFFFWRIQRPFSGGI